MLKLFRKVGRHEEQTKASSGKLIAPAPTSITTAAVVNNIHDSTINNVGGQQINNYYISVEYSATAVGDQSLEPPSSQPVPPEIFFGRDTIVDNAVHLAVTKDRVRIAILGGGGMGKTATALHILHHKDMIAKYGDRRYFVACDAITSAESVAGLVLQVLQVSPVSGENILTTLHNAVLHAAPTVLVLDNFETVWEPSASRRGIQDLLEKLSSAESLLILLTMRGSAPPSPIAWTHFEQLRPLLPDHAREVFLAVNMPSREITARDVEILDTLLKEIDFVPLAIRLLAQVGIGYSFVYLLERWRDERTAFLQTHEDAPDRLESVDVSISLSIKSPELVQSPEAVQLLGVLCQLPDGLICWQERLPLIASSMKSPHRLLRLLQKTALISVESDRVTVLSPIRHFVNEHHAAQPDHSRIMESFFWGLVKRYAGEEPGFDFISARRILEPDINNIDTLIMAAIVDHPSSQIIDAALKMSKFLFWIHPTAHILLKLKTVLSQCLTTEQEVQRLQILGNILFAQNHYDEASSALDEAQRHFKAIGNTVEAAKCLQSLGNILRMQNRHEEAASVLTESRGQFQAIGSTMGVAQCSQCLGDILYLQHRYEEATSVLTEAHGQFQAIGVTLGVAQCLQSLGDILRVQKHYEEAASVLTEARAQFQVIGSTLGVAQCTLCLGDILRCQKRFDEARVLVIEARDQSLSVGDVMTVSYCSQFLDEIASIQT